MVGEQGMARVEGARPRGLSGLFLRIVYFLTRRKVGRVVMPVQVHGHHPGLLFGYGMMEQSLAGGRRLEGKLKSLATLRTSTRIGCPF